MRIHRLNRRASSSPASATQRRTWRILLVCAGTLALVLATMGAVVALSGQSRAPKAQERPGAARPSATSASPQGSDDHGATKGAGSTNSTAGPVLADGTYPTFIKKVDIESATITVDVIQVFLDEAAASAAVEDGVDPSEAPFIYVYVRNQNPLLRSLSVAPGVEIGFVDTCDSPPGAAAALAELAERTATFDTTYYYDVTVSAGAITRITQHLAIAAC